MSLYEVLEVSPNASPEVIRAAYRNLMQRYHPDKLRGGADHDKTAEAINAAFQVLSDPATRARYDAESRPMPLALAGGPVRVAPRAPGLVFRSARELVLTAGFAVVTIGGLAMLVSEIDRDWKEHERRAEAATEHMVRELQKSELRAAERAAAVRAQVEVESLQAAAQDQAQRTLVMWEAVVPIDIVDASVRPPKPRAQIFPPFRVLVGQENAERVLASIASNRDAHAARVVKALRRLELQQLAALDADLAITRTIRDALNESVFGTSDEEKLCTAGPAGPRCQGVVGITLTEQFVYR